MEGLRLDWLCRIYYKPRYVLPLRKEIEKRYKERYGKMSLLKAQDTIDALSYTLVRLLRYKMDGCYFSCHGSRYIGSVICNGRGIKSGVGYIGVMNILSMLEIDGMISVSKGGMLHGEKINSYFILTQEGMDWIESMDITFPKSVPLKSSVIEIRDNNKESIVFKNTEELVAMREWVTEYNTLMSTHEVLVDYLPFPIHMVRKFIRESLAYGGRYYYTGLSVQTVEAYKRKGILIDGEATVELDYKSMHPAILAESNGVIWTKGFDPYRLDYSVMAIDIEALDAYKLTINPTHNPIRNLAKLALMCAINCKSKRQAYAALKHKFEDDGKKNIEDQKYYGILEFEPKMLYANLADNNVEIAKYFFTDTGVKLQRVDSDIAEFIMKACIRQDIPVLCIHDSFIVKRKHHGELHKLMKDGWAFRLGTNFNCYVEEK
jgi:hypothetical protein